MFRVRVTFTAGTGTPYLSTFFLNDGGSLTAQNAVAGVGAIYTSLASVIKAGHTWTTSSVVETVDKVTGQPTGITSVTPVTGTGSDSNQEAPQATQGLIEWRTGQFVGGREVRGRTFIPSLTTGSMLNGQPSSAYISALSAVAATYAAGTLWAPCVYSRKHHDTYSIVGGDVWTNFAVLKSRRT